MMKIFDRIDSSSLDRREMQLWILALTMILILSMGVALLMFPMAYSHPVDLTGIPARAIFFGFCALSALVVGYFIDRQLVIRSLRAELNIRKHQVEVMRKEASTDLLTTLPGLTIFRDRLAMEHRRAAHTQQHLSLLAVELKPSNALIGTGEVEIAFGDAAKTMMRKLRGEDSIFLLSPGFFGIVLPAVTASAAYDVRDHIMEGLHDTAGVSYRFTFSVTVVNYPEHAATAREMEGYILGSLPQKTRNEPHRVEQMTPVLGVE
jgi:GGDEF domain-containing protein